MDKKELYKLGIKAQDGDELAMLKIINAKKSLIKKYSYNDEDQYQYIVLKLIEAIKRYNFEK